LDEQSAVRNFVRAVRTSDPKLLACAIESLEDAYNAQAWAQAFRTTGALPRSTADFQNRFLNVWVAIGDSKTPRSPGTNASL
jgi:hypothetical protein